MGRDSRLLEEIIIRSHGHPKDLKAIIDLHGLLYAQEFGLDKSLQEYVANSCTQLLNSFNPDKDGRLVSREKEILLAQSVS